MDVAIYARLSQEDGAARPGEATATERQIADCRARAERESWNVLAIYEDPDHSASNLRRPRPDFERMLSDLSDGVHVDAVVCYKLDRLLRHPKEAERIIELADRRGFGIVSLNDPGIDLTTPTGRAMFRMTITWAKLETETMSLRIRRKTRDIAETGRPNGGGIRSFGLTADKLTIVPAEAALVREAAERILAGGSVHSVVVDWNARGVRTPGRKSAPEGRKWEVSSLKRMLTAPRIVGDRTLHGATVGGGVIPALLDRATWDRLRAVLAAPRGPSAGATVRRHYLTGLTRCGRCGAKLVAHPDWRGTTRYVCASPRGCGGITIAKHNLEPLIAEAIAIRLDSDEFRAVVAQRLSNAKAEPDLDQLRADEAALEEAAAAYFVDRTISRAEYTKVRELLDARIDSARRRLEAASSTTGLGRLAGRDIRAEWEGRSAVWRHDVAGLLIDRVIVNPAPRRGPRFDPARIDVEWRV
ncbi:MAG: recombinase family protein [Chloroflexi bacterium]|nr:recombinase family protein [Chloroflexota bacterium]